MPKTDPPWVVLERRRLKRKKRLYDKQYRRKNAARLKRVKAAYYQRTYDPAKAAKARKKTMPRHVEYCRRPRYRRWKAGYDVEYLAKTRYGKFWECMILVRKIQKEVCRLVPDKYDRMKMRGHIRRAMMKSAMKKSLLYGWNFNYSECP